MVLLAVEGPCLGGQQAYRVTAVQQVGAEGNDELAGGHAAVEQGVFLAEAGDLRRLWLVIEVVGRIPLLKTAFLEYAQIGRAHV